MSKNIMSMTAAALLLVGCASVPKAPTATASEAKRFNPPSAGMAGLYIYRRGGVGGALKKDLWVNGKCIGESAPKVFFFEEVAGNQEHTIATESEFSPNELKLVTEANRNYFIEQYMKFGVVVGGANLKLVNETEGKAEVSKLDMAAKGTCSG